jgi:hypothetical protein
MELIQWGIANYKDLLLIVTGLVTVCSIIVKLTPTPKDDALLAKIMPFVEKLALNKKA